MALFPVPHDPLQVVWQNTVVDVEPSSRYGQPGKTPDTASINTTMVLDEPPARPVEFITPGHYEQEVSARILGRAEGVSGDLVTPDDARYDELMGRLHELHTEVGTDDAVAEELLGRVKRFHVFTLDFPDEARMVRFFSRLPIIEEDDGSYKVSVFAPMEFTALAKGGDFSVVALLPRPARDYPTPPTYNVRLRSYSREPEPQVFGEKEAPAIAERLTVSWYWRVDPRLEVEYIYF